MAHRDYLAALREIDLARLAGYARAGFVEMEAVALDAALSPEGLRHDIDPVMSLPARPVPGMAFVLVRFVHHLEALRRESLGQLLCDEIGGSHAALD